MLEQELNRIFRNRPTAEWLELMERGGMPAGAVLSVGEMHADPQTRAREMVVALDHPVAGRMETLGLPVKFSSTPGAVRGPAPLLGQHTREVLGELGYGDGEIERMLESGAAIQSGDPVRERPFA